MTEHDQQKDAYIVGLRFQKVGKIYHFNANKYRDIKPGDFVVVETSRGIQLGQVIQIVEPADASALDTIKPLLRPATPQDLVMRQVWQQKESDAVEFCREKVKELGLTDVKIISAEYSFDGSKLYFLFSSEAGEKADLRSLRRALQRMFQATKIEMHLIGPRDVAKLLGGMGACGLEHRCCSAFLTEFSPISIKMAKEQGISLTPTEITGMCGRLRCCLVYEYEHYLEARKQLPRRGKWVQTPAGEGRVVDIFPLKESVVVALEQGTQREFLKNEIELIDEPDASKTMADTSASKPSTRGGDYSQRGKKKGRDNSSN